MLFTKSKTKTSNKINNKTNTMNCFNCGLHKKAQTPKMQPFGNFKKGILNIGEAPNEIDDQMGKQWEGKTGRILKQELKKLGIDLFEDCLNYNAINCRPIDKYGNNRNPSTNEINYCYNECIERIIRQQKPKVIILFGYYALLSVIGNRWKKDLGNVNKWRGFCIPDKDLNAWICPVFDPNYILQNIDRPEVRTVWTQDLQQAVNKTYVPIPKNQKSDDNCIHILENESEIINILLNINRKKGINLAFDIETTGLKPYAKGHKIICISFCYRPDLSYCFPMPSNKKSLQLLKKILENKNIYKIAANMKFEDTWLRHFYDIKTNPFIWDTVLAAHIIDNRQGITSLKFQTYINFGIADYDSEIDPYLKSENKLNSNSFNKALYCMQEKEKDLRKKLMHYCALDSLYTYKLAMKQIRILETK